VDASRARGRAGCAAFDGRYEALAGGYRHAEHDDTEALPARIDDLREHDLNAVRLRR